MEDVKRDNSSVRFYTGLHSLSCLLMLFYFLKSIASSMKYWDGKKKDTSSNIPGKTVVINVVFIIAHKMFHEKFNYVFYFHTTNKNHLICP